MTGKIVVLTGGVGGSKLVDGLTQIVPPEEVVAIVNTGDDFDHLGLHISPDIDTLLYTLSGQANVQQGWGRQDESWQFMDALQQLGGPQWFRLGDGDLALHVLRTEALARGEPLSAIIRGFARSWGIAMTVLPATDGRLATIVGSDEGALPFQRYFVERRCEPVVRYIRFEGAAECVPAPGLIDSLLDGNARAILIAPSNPFLSIDPILAVPGIRTALAAAPAPVVAVSPLVGGTAVKGPTAKIMAELGLPISAAAVAAHYEDFLDGLLVDERDPAQPIDVANESADTLMIDGTARARVAAAALHFADRLG